MRQKLHLHRLLLPSLKMWCRDNPTFETVAGSTMETPMLENLTSLQTAVIFDCRDLPNAFVDDTGEAYWHEAEETKEIIKLPFPICYFEFTDGVRFLAWESEYVWGLDDQDEPVLLSPPPPAHVEIMAFSDDMPLTHEGPFFTFNNGHAECFDTNFPDGINPTPAFYDMVNCQEDSYEQGLKLAATRLLGVMALLKERLVFDDLIPDPDPKGSEKRAARNQLPWTSDSHVLKVNVPAVRSAVRASGGADHGSHSSPALHWRRGHWRTLHRGSEFETRAWVRKCLVGDPAKGFIQGSYRLTHEMPMMVH